LFPLPYQFYIVKIKGPAACTKFYPTAASVRPTGKEKENYEGSETTPYID